MLLSKKIGKDLDCSEDIKMIPHYKQFLHCWVQILKSHPYFLNRDDMLKNKPIFCEVNIDSHIRKYFNKQKPLYDNWDEELRLLLTESIKGTLDQLTLLEETLMVFYTCTGEKFQRNEYFIFLVLLYLVVFNLERKITFSVFSKLVKTQSPYLTAVLLGFMFSQDNMENIILPTWSKLYDKDYIKTVLTKNIVLWSSQGAVLVEDLVDILDKGMVPKLKHAHTQPSPFTLTVPKPRRFTFPEPIPKVGKALPLPWTNREPSHVHHTIERLKSEFRLSRKDEYDKLEKTNFRLAKLQKEASLKYLNRKTPKPITPIPAFKATYPLPKSEPPIKHTLASILREDALLKRAKETEAKEVQELITNLNNPHSYDDFKEESQLNEQKNEKLRLEKLKLSVQLGHEHAVEAKVDNLTEKRDTVVKLKEDQVELKKFKASLQKEQDTSNKIKIAQVHATHYHAQEAKLKLHHKKFQEAVSLQQINKELKDEAEKRKKEELEKKMQLIQQIKELQQQIIVSKTEEKQVDFTKTAGFGMLGEMSIAELTQNLEYLKVEQEQQRLAKRNQITKEKQFKHNLMEQKRKEIQNFQNEKRMSRKIKRKDHKALMASRTQVMNSDDALEQLKNDLLQKKLERQNLLNKFRPRPQERQKKQEMLIEEVDVRWTELHSEEEEQPPKVLGGSEASEAPMSEVALYT